MEKCLFLNMLEPTKAKRCLLKETYQTFFDVAKEALKASNGVRSRGQLHKVTYKTFMIKYHVASQLVIEASSYAWSNRKTITAEPKKCVIRFDKRLFSFKQTKRGNPVLSLRLNHERIGLPTRQDGAYQRLKQHLKDGWNPTSIIMKRNLRFLVVLFKAMPKPTIRPNIMGIDINSSKIAVSIISGKRVLKQTYYGQDVSTRQFHFEERRALLQEHRDTVSRGKAGLKLRRLSGNQRNYVRTRIWQISNEIVKLAKRFNANIAIEGLRNLRKRKGEWGRKSRRKTNRIPYGFFRYALKHIAEREGVAIQEVNARYTSQTCPKCGYISKKNWIGYKYFKCIKCRCEANRDRIASLNIAERASQVANPYLTQIPLGDPSVNKGVLKDEGVERWHQTHQSFKPMNSFMGR
jgi:IS605 OrfB family transposase